MRRRISSAHTMSMVRTGRRHDLCPCEHVCESPLPWRRVANVPLPRVAVIAASGFWQIAEQVGESKTAEDCETLFRQHQGYLSLNVEYHSDVVFATMVHDHFNAVPQKVSAVSARLSCRPASGNSCRVAGFAVACRCDGRATNRYSASRERRLPTSRAAHQQASSQVTTAEGGAAGGSLISSGSSAPPSAAKGRRTPRPGFRV